MGMVIKSTWYNPNTEIVADLPVIYLFKEMNNEVALAEDGTILLDVGVSRIEQWLNGCKSFRTHYPGGYQASYVAKPYDHPGVKTAMSIHVQRKVNGK